MVRRGNWGIDGELHWSAFCKLMDLPRGETPESGRASSAAAELVDDRGRKDRGVGRFDLPDRLRGVACVANVARPLSDRKPVHQILVQRPS
jgi:hypothetical protein